MRVPIPKWLNDLIGIVFSLILLLGALVFAIKGDGIEQILGILVAIILIYAIYGILKK